MADDLASEWAVHVRSPRASDAVGSALRGMFGDVGALPYDMLAALGRLDAAPRSGTR